MQAQGTPFIGLLYVGLALTSTGPKVVEFNVRFGDPETEPLLSLLESPLASIMLAAAQADLSTIDGLRFRPEYAVGVVLASQGYPSAPITGRPITGLTSQDADVLHAGTRLDGDQLVASGGRVLVVLGHGETLAGARQEAYQNISEIQLDGGFHRDDIAAAAAEQEAVAGLASGNSSHEAPRHAAATPEEPSYRNNPSTN